MMESCFHNKLETMEGVDVDDLRKDLFSEFHSLDPDGTCLQEMEHLQVFLRIRPFTTAENENCEAQDCVSIESPDTVLLKAPRSSLSARLSDRSVPQTAQRFQFSQVLGPETTQKEMFDRTVRNLVKDVLEGGNSLVFTYGVTNAGKTFTFLGPEANAGVLPRSLNVIFSSIEGRVYNQMTIKPQRCREFIRLTKDQQSDEAANKRNLFRVLKEVDNQKTNVSHASSTGKTTLEGSTLNAVEETVTEDCFSLVVDTHTKFSVWVSFCEIYNENIHDLLEPIPNGAVRRSTLRLSQDVKGNSFVKDLKWVQVNNAEEAYKVMKLGKKNQSFASTKLNLLSSRSHSIFSVRILRIEDSRIPRVNCISELSLCDLAGSERCAKTQNKGERLKEAGNINTSLMTLGKCINALRHSQQSKLPQHVPFRESKLTHYLQGFFCGRGKACMIVNINQCASMFDETLNVLKFSAVAQKVVVLTTKTVPPLATKRSARELSMIINNADRKNLLGHSRRSSLVAWENSLEDVPEDEDDETEEDEDTEEDEESTVENTVMDESMPQVDDDKIVIDKGTYKKQLRQLKELQDLVQKVRSENLALESRIREEVTREFADLFSEMQQDYNDRLVKEKEIIEERAETRLMILKNLMNKNSQEERNQAEKEGKLSFGDMFDSMCSDVAGIKEVAEAAKTCLVTEPDAGSDTVYDMKARVARLSVQLNEALEQLSVKTKELDHFYRQAQQANEQLEEASKSAETQELKSSHLLDICNEKDEMISQLQITVEEQAKAASQNKTTLDSIKQEILLLKRSCTCFREERASSRNANRKRLVDLQPDVEDQPPSKKGVHEACSGGAEEKTDRLRAEPYLRSSEMVGLEEVRVRALPGACQAQAAKLDAPEADALRGCQTTRDHEVRGENALIASLTQEVTRLRQEVGVCQTVSEVPGDSGLRLDMVGQKRDCSEALEESERSHKQIQMLEGELEQKLSLQKLTSDQEKEELKQKLSLQKLTSDQEMEELKQKLSLQKLTSDQEKEELKQKLSLQKLTSDQEMEELKQKLSLQKLTSDQEMEELKQKLSLQKLTSDQEMEELKQKLSLQKLTSDQEMEELKQKLSLQKLTSDQEMEELKQKLSQQQVLEQELEELKQKLSQQELTVEQLKNEVKETKTKDNHINSERETAEMLSAPNSDLEAEVASLKRKIADLEEKECAWRTEREAVTVSQVYNDELLAQTERAAELEKRLSEMEVQVSGLQRSLRDAQDRREEEETAAVQEARRREVERRRELLAVAEEAIAQKDAELEKRAQDVTRLKELAKIDSDKVKSLSLDLQRKEDDTSDLKEKLADAKKQIQQVQREISSVRDEDKCLKQKLQDLEKLKKQQQAELANRDRSIQQLRTELAAESKSDVNLKLYEKACQDLQVKERVIEDMRLALTELEETQTEQDQVLEAKLDDIEALTEEVEKLKALLRHRDSGEDLKDSQSDDAKQEALQAQLTLKTCTDKHQADRRKWLEEKMVLIRQAKEAEEKRNQEMRKYADGRERHAQQQSQLEALSAQLREKEQDLLKWRKERDSLVAALEVQLTKLLSSNADKDKLIASLRCDTTSPPPERDHIQLEELQSHLSERETEILTLKEQLKAALKSGSVVSAQSGSDHRETATQTEVDECPLKREAVHSGSPLVGGGTMAKRNSQRSGGYPSVLESSEISTEGGRTSRFPKPELEISFSPLQPNRMALKRQGEDVVNVKITRSARKRKSTEIDKEVNSENQRNNWTRLTPKLAMHQEEPSTANGSTDLSSVKSQDSQSSLRNKKEGTMQKIGDFINSSPTFFGTKAKKIMGLVSGKSPETGLGSSRSLKPKRSKRKLFRSEISSPMNFPSHTIISDAPDQQESDHLIIKRKLRSRTGK
ncbi:kinesin-like protein KIF20B isoform X2 [Esox lucius]|uniref:Kinesin motor domain-containing protein n=1 Tax=Esox lucius TaxID=8010 RepID=A0A3P9A4M8_ESOLU|nr:kinesin-like protein KIF20B isoform X2 [Esox lucius]